MASASEGSARSRLRMALAAALGMLLLAACSSSAPAGASSALRLGLTVFTPASAPRVPSVAGKLVGGGRLSLAAYGGHVVVVNFWASWCTICRQEAPALSAVAQRFQASGVRFVGIDVGDNAASATAFMRSHRLDYPSLFDPGDAIPLRFTKIIPIAALPSTLVISPGGHVAGRIIGAVSVRDMMKLIEIAESRHE